MRGTLALVVAVLLLVSAVGVLPTTGAQSFASDDQQSVVAPHEHDGVNNFTAVWRDGYFGDPGDPESDPWGVGNPQYPGNDDVTFTAFSRGFPGDLLPAGNLTILFPQAQGNHCEITAARALGIDRGNDDPGTQTDVSMLNFHGQHRWQRNASVGAMDDGKNVTTIDFYNEGEGFTDNTIDLYQEDEVTAAQADCFTQPRTPGWYRWLGGLNGTQDGDPADSSGDEWRSDDWFGDDPDEQAMVYSHWYYVCQCDSRQDAVQKMGPPPTSGQTAPVVWAEDGVANTEMVLAAYDVDGDGIPDEVTNDKTTEPADYWSSDTGDGYEAGNWQERQARASGNGDGDPTPTDAGPTPTDAGPTPTDAGPTPTDAGPTPTDGGPTPTDGGPTPTDGDGGPTPTETSTGQPGFGPVVAVVALLGAALLALRRR